MLLTILLAGIAGGPGFQPDREIIAVAQELRTSVPRLSPVAAMITMLGGAAITLPAAGFATIYLLFKRQTLLALILTVTVLGERALVDWLKAEVARPRPPNGELLVSSLAFPSGHAANSMTVYLAIALLAVPLTHRRLAVIAAIALSLLIGLTRIVLGVHWPSDVVGGWAIGLVTVALAVAVARRSGALRLEPKHQVIRRHGDAVDKPKTP